MVDEFSNLAPGLSSPAEHAAIVTPDDNADLANASRALWIGDTGGAIKVTTVGGETLVFPDVPANTLLPLRVARVHNTDTTATPIVALW